MFDHIQTTAHRLTVVSVLAATVAMIGGLLLLFLPNVDRAKQLNAPPAPASRGAVSQSELGDMTSMVNALTTCGNAPDEDAIRRASKFLSQCSRPDASRDAPPQQSIGLVSGEGH